MRIVGGIFKAKNLKEFSNPAIRPTADKTRESLFDILGERISGAKFLDLFAGTGGVGIEAISRGAKKVTFLAGEEPVGPARLWWRDGAFWLGDVGVLSDFRGMSYGDLLVRLLLFKALSHGAHFLRLEAPEEAVAFFARYGCCEECRTGRSAESRVGQESRSRWAPDH